MMMINFRLLTPSTEYLLNHFVNMTLHRDIILLQDPKSFLGIDLNNYDIKTTEPAIVDVGPEIDVGTEMDASNEVEEFTADDNLEDDDDEIPLVMLQDFKSKKRKNSEEVRCFALF